MVENQSRNSRAFIAGIAIVLATFAAYSSVRYCGFIWDDDDYVTKNKTLRDMDGLVRIWLDAKSNPQYYPLVYTSFWLEYQTWGLNPLGFHLVNIAVHAISAVLLWRILLRLSVPGAWFAATLFALHPVHVESVAWITERKNVLSGLFYLSATYCFLRFAGIGEFDRKPISPEPDTLADEKKPSENSQHAMLSLRSLAYYVATIVFFVCALLSKTVVATFPAAMLVIVWWKRDRLAFRDVLPLVPFFAIGIRFGLLTVQLEKNHVGAKGMEWDFSVWERVLIAGRVVWFYFAKLIWPHPLIFTYPRWNITDAAIWQYAFPVAAFAVIVALWLLRARLGRGPLAAVLLFVGTLFPALGFFDVYPMRFSFVADHFQYLASIAMIALVVATFVFMMAKIAVPKKVSMAIGFGVIAVLATMTWRQVAIYENLETLWRRTLAQNPSSFMAHNNLGSLLSRRGEYAQAEKHFRQSLEIKPDDYDANANLGLALDELGRLRESEKSYLRAIELRPEFPLAYNGLGIVYAKQGKMNAAKTYLSRALELQPDYPQAHLNLGSVLQSENQIDAAIAEFEQAIRLQPNFFAAQYNLALAHFAKGDLESAESQMRIAIKLEPNNPVVRMNLGAILMSQKNYEGAIACFAETIKMAPRYAEAYYNMGVAYDARGDRRQANENFQKADALRKSAGQFSPRP